MSVNDGDRTMDGNNEEDWEIFDVLCKDIEPPCGEHLTHSLDLVTTLRSELAASTYKRDRLLSELTEVRSAICAKETECEALKTQTARQSALIASLQNRLQNVEQREKNFQAKSESTTQTLQREKRSLDEKSKELITKVRRLECELSTEEAHREQARAQLHDLLRRLSLCFSMEACTGSHVSSEDIVTRATEIVTELQKIRTKMTATCETLHNCESELLNTRTIACADKQRLQQQVDSLQASAQDLENRCRIAERDLQINRDRLAECEVNGNKLREELRGFESRCCRLQNTMDRLQSDRLQFLRCISTLICVPEPCETLIKDKVREIVSENQSFHTQIMNMREQIASDSSRHRETVESFNCRFKTEEEQKCAIEDRLEKAHQEIHAMKAEHQTLSEYLVRLARALCWSECTSPPSQGTDTNILAETLLERAERLSVHHENHIHGSYDHHSDHHSHSHSHHHHHSKMRRERSCHDLPLKESSAMYTLQRRVRVLREQVQRRDLHLELLKRKLTLLEDNARGKCIVQTQRDEALCRARRSTKQAERTSQQLMESKAQLAEVKAQLAEASDYKITALERARKIDELQTKIIDMENDRARLMTQVTNYKARARSAVESSSERNHRDEQTIHNLREELVRMKAQLSELNHRLSHLQTFRSSVARLLHLRDVPHEGLLQRLQTLCSAHQEFTLLSRRYESASPIGEHPCPRYDDLIPPSSHCRPISSSPSHIRRYEDSGLDDHFDDDFDFSKKY